MSEFQWAMLGVSAFGWAFALGVLWNDVRAVKRITTNGIAAELRDVKMELAQAKLEIVRLSEQVRMLSHRGEKLKDELDKEREKK
jgi:hypothetical protein